MSGISLNNATPRIHLFFLAIFIKIIAAALAAIGFVLNSACYQIAGAAVWLVFLVLLLFIAVPAADAWLRPRLRLLRTASMSIIIIFCLAGLVLLAVATTIGLESIDSGQPEGKLSRLMVSLDNVFGYNDATALSHQAAENVLHGGNPYAEANIVTAMVKFNGATDKLTPLREGRFTDVFPYPRATQMEQLWQDALKNPSQVPPELESKFNYPAFCFLLPAPFIWMGIGDFRFFYIILLELPGRRGDGVPLLPAAAAGLGVAQEEPVGVRPVHGDGCRHQADNLVPPAFLSYSHPQDNGLAEAAVRCCRYCRGIHRR
jgi:hypothetical protein